MSFPNPILALPGPVTHALAACVTVVCLNMAAPAVAASIDGLSLEPIAAHAVTPAVNNRRLEINMPENEKLTVSPWPRFLPQHFSRQEIAGTREMAPAGPIDRLSFTRTTETKPWLIIANGARPASPLIGAWRLQLSGLQWSASNGASERVLGQGEDDAVPIMLNVDHRRWCIYLLESRMPAPSHPGIASEEEPQIMWAAWQIGRSKKRCPAQR